MVEFALIVPVLLALLLGIMEFGWLAKNRLQLANAVRPASRRAASTAAEGAHRVTGCARSRMKVGPA